jgi:cytochrome c553
MRRRCALLVATLFPVFLNVAAVYAAAPGPKFKEGGNKHNLSSANTGVKFQAVATPGDPERRDTQVCTFCHTPHNSAPQTVLWNRKDPTTTFGRYSSASLVIRGNTEAKYGEPNGSSRLCLSCHDGVTALGDVLNGPLIDFGANDKITGIAKFDANKVKLGHHPVSFVYNATVASALAGKAAPYNGTYTVPTGPPWPNNVQLFAVTDRNKKEWMQCATCHDPHQNKSDDTYCYNSSNDIVPCDSTNTRKVAPFWVFHATGNSADQDHDAVCTTCHDFSMYNPPSTQPWP